MPARKKSTASASAAETEPTPTFAVPVDEDGEVGQAVPLNGVDETEEQAAPQAIESDHQEDVEVPVPVAKGFVGGTPICEEHDRMIPEIGKTTREIFEAFRQPFDPALLYYKPQQVSKDKTKCQVAVYADPRAYIDRLNEAVGPENWGAKFETIVIPARKSEGWGENRKVADIHKVQIYCTMWVTGMGSHQEIGEEFVDNPNVSTVALAMAFKRACMTFGIGRYLYDFPKNQWCDYDEKKKKVKNPPALPDFAYPVYTCADCRGEIGWSKRRVNDDEVEDISPAVVAATTKKMYGVQICGPCAKARRDKAASESGASGRLQ